MESRAGAPPPARLPRTHGERSAADSPSRRSRRRVSAKGLPRQEGRAGGKRIIQPPQPPVTPARRATPVPQCGQLATADVSTNLRQRPLDNPGGLGWTAAPLPRPLRPGPAPHRTAPPPRRPAPAPSPPRPRAVSAPARKFCSAAPEEACARPPARASSDGGRVRAPGAARGTPGARTESARPPANPRKGGDPLPLEREGVPRMRRWP